MIRTLMAGLVMCAAALSGVAHAADAPAGTSGQAQAADPAAVIKSLQDALIATMKDGAKLGFKGRFSRLDPVVTRTHDFAFIARLVLGSDGAKLPVDQQNRFVKAFTQLGVSTYAKEFDSFSGERFEPNQTQNSAAGTVVLSTLQIPDHDPVKFEYQMHQADGQWKIVNIIADGVSDLALKRTQYRELLRQKGFDGLMSWVNQQIQKQAEGSGG